MKMKIKFIFLITIISIITTLPAFAEYNVNPGADYASLYHLNKLVRTNNLQEQLLLI